MTKKLILLSFIALTIIICGCSKESPVAPDLTGNDAGISLDKPSVTVVNFTFDEGKPESGDPGQQWVDDQGVLHIRGQIGINAPVAGDFVGYDRHNVFNADIDLATGNGKFTGVFTMEVEWTARNLKGVFSGRYKGEFTNWLLTGATTCIGEGAFAGMVLRFEQKGDGPGSYFLICTGTVTER